MLSGRLLDGRFELAEVAGSGGMGTVYRALDRASGAVVALKLLHKVDAHAQARFDREARALSRMEHPHIVRYATHGVASTGEPYLAMEWLSGESLAARLSRQELRVEESVALVRAVADALGAAHARGIVHRDIKPSNLFLVDGVLDRVKVIDFGIAQLPDTTSRLTQTAAVVGTLGYMAPEQARGDQETLDARADIFSLGCVLFECLTGQRAFRGQHVAALLWKLLLEEPPRARALRPAVPEALDELLARMLAKDARARPEDGVAVARCLDALGALERGGALDESGVAPDPPLGEVITTGERRLTSIVAVRPAQASFLKSTETLSLDEPSPSTLATVRRAALPLGAQVEVLADGVVVAMVVGAGSATDQTALVARCALQIRASLSGAAVVLVTGRGEPTGRASLGEVLERAAGLLENAGAPARAGSRHEGVHIDAVTRALLDVRFEVVEQDGLCWLEAEREIGEGARKLLGKPSPYVGRERELRSLRELVEESFTEGRAAAALVTAPAGMGKSRLRHELVQALRQRHADLDLGVVRGDAIGAGSAFAMVAGALRGALGIAAGEPLDVRREKLARVLEPLFAGEDRLRVAGFLGELLGVALMDEEHPALRAARQSPAVMAEAIQRAYLDYARAVASVRPVLVVLEDLHWGDAPSVRIFDRALRELGDRPYAVLAFGRPEVHELFPRLWAERGLSELRLRELPVRAAEQLVRSALGASIEPEQVSALVRQAGGNAFYLEELIRAVAEGRGGALPETVLGMVEARLAALGPEARRLLRAASVFGEVSWARGVGALLGALAPGTSEHDAWAGLFEREILERRPISRFAGEEEVGFRHALLREGAYAMLTDRDRALGHRLAGEWLLEAGEQDPMVLAEHFARGGDGARAAELYLRASELALRGADLPAVLARAQKGIACGAAGETLAALHVQRMDALVWNDAHEEAHASALWALEASTPGSHSSWRVLTGALTCVANFDDRRVVEALLPRLNPADLPVDAQGAEFACRILFVLLWEGVPALAARYMHRIERDLAPALEGDPYAEACVQIARGAWLCQAARDPWGALNAHLAAVRLLDALGHHLYSLLTSTFVAQDCMWLGALDIAEQHIGRVLASEGAPGFASSGAVVFRIASLLERRRLTEALDLAGAVLRRATVRHVATSRNAILRLLRAEAYLLCGELAEAEEELRAVGDPDALVPLVRTMLLSSMAELRLRQGRAGEAVAFAREALDWDRRAGAVFAPRQESLPAIYAEALHASGDAEAAREVIRAARDELLARADRISDPAFRRGFLENVSANARTLALASAWLGEGSSPAPHGAK
ncbi:protein kinase [Sorangium cellulosum]|uniref:Protein kinase n=1 Tax=Sorangium cellulosum TaxID=56 RepID=A0A2L0F872_SORCE|nr:serine/threonine-protein kinase [Sorangium cellulosum]AUX47717.1 protein kinase [Sorangium cellulosum]